MILDEAIYPSPLIVQGVDTPSETVHVDPCSLVGSHEGKSVNQLTGYARVPCTIEYQLNTFYLGCSPEAACVIHV